MATYPSTPSITATGGSLAGINYTYEHDVTDTTNLLASFDFTSPSGSANQGRKIAIKWSGSVNQINVNYPITGVTDSYPYSFTINSGNRVGSGDTWTTISSGDTISLYDHATSGTMIFSFVAGSTNIWSGSNTGTEGVAIPDGTIQRFGTNITWSIDANSPTSSVSNVYSLQLDGVSQYPNGITHSNGTHTTVTISTQIGVWKLWHQGTTNDTELASLTVSRKRVFCNFW